MILCMKAMLRPRALRAMALCALLHSAPAAFPQSAAQAPSPTAITLDEAIRRAEANEPTFAAAAAESRALRLERTDARAALLPTASYHNQYLYTESNGLAGLATQTSGAPPIVFIANNAVHEYISQGLLDEKLGLAQVGAIRLADANAAKAAAELEVARRGLISTVVNLYYSVGSQAAKLNVAKRALAEANGFVQVTQQRENAGEVAHADVIKAQLQQQQRQRELADAQLVADKARLELGVLLFPDPSTTYDLAPAAAPPPLPDRTTVETAAKANNPELKSALASLQVNQAQTYAARAALLPELSLNATYGIDAPQFAVNGPDGTRNLGYSASATLDIPVWDWFTAERKIKESRLRADAAKVALTAAQRRLVANLSEFYAEAAAARLQLASLDASVVDARESLRLVNLRYQASESTVLDVVDAQNTLTAAENAQADGVVRYQLALAQLQTLTGRL